MAPRHRARRRRSTRPIAAGLVVALLAVSGVAAYALSRDPSADRTAARESEPTTTPCTNTLQVVTATSFAPVLAELAPTLAAAGDDCVSLQVDVRDGRTAPQLVAETSAHLWIPDDGSWTETARDLDLAEEGGGAGTVIATSPLYMVAGKAAAKKIADAGGTWEALAKLAANDVTLVVREPNGSGDGLIGLGSVAEAVWVKDGMNPSAAALADAHSTAETVAEHALPSNENEVGVVPEYVLLRLLENPNREIAAGVRNA
ncbi:MAG: substrate-binding domain-containing protein, partial [Jiangellaceae bacterium]|nr:substrate-binding domain-containing protein [Jiangellaceae bacterium]